MNKQTIIFGLVFWLLVAGALAVPPPSQTFGGTNGLQIEFPAFEYGRINTSFTFPFHVYNLQDGLVVNESTVCTLHVYNNVGEHIAIEYQNVASHGRDYEFLINDSLFRYEADFRFVVDCQCSACGSQEEDLGGFVSHGFTINNEGEPKNTSGTGLLAIIILIPILFGLFMIIGAVSLGEDHAVLKIFLFLLSPVTIFVSFHFATISLIKYYTLSSLQQAVGNTTFWIAILFFVLISYFVIYTIWKAVEVAAQKRKERLNY